ncbi:MAG: preprotein translocase subunit SecA [Candidatus Gracilibacteria bacterium]|jgi:preprotein translocase subunit SecA|nr:preprotein translocase subunit SecA [Candidatus Gracilibacteria bacterium]
MISALKSRLFDRNAKEIKKILPLVKKINEIYEEYKASITDQEAVLKKTEEFKERIKNGEPLDKLLPEAFALVKTACSHLVGKQWLVRGKSYEWNMIPFDVQLIGGIVLHKGNIAEMKTGEGKTLVSSLPVYLNALTGKGVFVVTVNDYLAQRDSEWIGGLYEYLGLSVGTTVHGQTAQEKKQAYEKDITYGTNNEFGFDYLRDNMVLEKEHVTQKNLYYAIVDEVDSILIDEARTPLIISAPAEESTAKYKQYARLIPQLKENEHYNIDEKSKSATLNENGIEKMENLLGMENIYTEAGFTEVHHIEQALRAQACYKKDIDYIVKDDEIIIIDEFTGRLMQGRRFSEGLHQAIEAKENVEVKRESKTLATISFQNYFRLFEKLGGMTGTAATEAEEFYTIYGLDTITIPTNKPIQRLDRPDSIFKTQKGKYLASVKKIKELHQKGQPVLAGTISVEKSEVLSKLLSLEGVPHNVLNAKNHEREAEIIAQAGQKGAVTIATNMAGRGTDIKLDEEAKKAGGLFVLGTDRHESRRIDNQLRGRSGRQGDPGETSFFVSLEDDLLRLFGGERMKSMMNLLKVPEDMPIETRMISKSIESAQKKVEGRNFDIRKHLVEYDDVMNIHRDIIYKLRRKFLFNESQSEEIKNMMNEIIDSIVDNHTSARQKKDWNIKEIFETVNSIHQNDTLSLDNIEKHNDADTLKAFIKEEMRKSYLQRFEILPDKNIREQIERAVFLRANDSLWTSHIDLMTSLRENVAFSGYAQKNPLNEYKSQGYSLFMELLHMIKFNTINTLFKIDIEKIVPAELLRKAEIRGIKTNANEIENLKSTRALTEENINPVFTRSRPSAPINVEKVGRNDPCPCGSGKKYKKCCELKNEN